MEHHRTRILADLEGIDCATNCVGRTPLHMCSVNDNMCIGKMTMPPGFGDDSWNGGGAGGAGPAGVPVGVNGPAN